MLQHHNRESYETFFQTTGVLDERPMADASISYIAFKTNGQWRLARAKVYLDSLPESMLPPHETASVRIGRHRFADLGKSVKQFLDDSIDASTFEFPEGSCAFLCDDHGYSTNIFDLHHDGLRQNNRLRMLSISGKSSQEYFNELAISWELKSHAQPYDSLEELAKSYGTGIPNGGQPIVELIAYQTTAIEKPVSTIKTGEVSLCQVLLNGFDPSKASLGYIVYRGNRALKRGSIDGTAMTWTAHPEIQRGRASLSVEVGSVVKCFARYAGITHHETWVDDPSLAQNPRRTAYSTFDEALIEMKALLEGPYVKGRDARQVETALSWVLWMLGFSPIQIGGVKKTQTAPDLIVAAPSGDLALVECTTGLLGADKKLPQLAARTVLVRNKLDAAGNFGTRLISILITTRSRDEVAAELDQAHQMNILVATKEDIDRSISQSLISMDANALYDLACKKLDDRRQKHQPPF